MTWGRWLPGKSCQKAINGRARYNPERENMSSGKRQSRYEGYTLAYTLFAIAIAILIAWFSGNWLTFVPVFLVEVGLGYLALGLLVMPEEANLPPSRRDAFYYIIWGSISSLVGIEWFLNGLFPGNVPFLIALFIIWMGVIALLLVMSRNREQAGVPRR